MNMELNNIFSRITVFCVAAVAALTSCGPSVYVLDIETRQPSLAGVDLAGRTVSVVYTDSGNPADSVFSAEFASAFVSELESDYFGGDSLVTVFCLDEGQAAETPDKARMADLLVETGSDVVFLFASPEIGNYEGSGSGQVPFSVGLYVYDSMDSRDSVLFFSGSSMAEISDPTDAALIAGKASGNKFSPRWKAESIVFFVYDSQIWYDTYRYVNEYEWQKAMDVWMSMLGTANLEKKACLEYNLAAACYLQGEYGLALEWLQLSEEHFQLPYRQNLKSKIAGKIK